MRCVFLLVVMVGVTWGRPSDFQISTTPPTPTQPAPVLVKDLGNLTIHVSQQPQGDYALEVYEQQGDTQHRLPTTVWSLPGDWRPPGLEFSKLLHAEVLDTGDVVVAFFSLENGLDLVLLPKELFVIKRSESGIIVYPKLEVPWHPTVSTPTEQWRWDTTTPPYLGPAPEVEK